MVTLSGRNSLQVHNKKLFCSFDITETSKDHRVLAIPSYLQPKTPGYRVQRVMQPCKALFVLFCAIAASKLHCHSLCTLDCNLFHAPLFTKFAPSVFANNFQAMFVSRSESRTKSDQFDSESQQ